MVLHFFILVSFSVTEEQNRDHPLNPFMVLKVKTSVINLHMNTVSNSHWTSQLILMFFPLHGLEMFIYAQFSRKHTHISSLTLGATWHYSSYLSLSTDFLLL